MINFAKLTYIKCMAKEIERKFIVKNTDYIDMAVSCHKIRQGYLSTNPQSTVRIRVIDNLAFLTVKSKNIGATRNEWEYCIPEKDAVEILEKCSSEECWQIKKTRYIVPYRGHTWEIDVFHGVLQGLTVAEIELTEEFERFEKPEFIGIEVTDDPRFYNSSLIKSKSIPKINEE